jgi:hypothetical protein
VRGRAAGTKAAALTVCFWQVIGIDVLHGCKGLRRKVARAAERVAAMLDAPCCDAPCCDAPCCDAPCCDAPCCDAPCCDAPCCRAAIACADVWHLAEPEKQFALVQRHIDAIQHRSEFMDSEIVVMVERNLGL